MVRLAKSRTQVLESGARSCNRIVKIQRFPLKFGHSAIYVDLVKTIKIFITSRFCLTYPNKGEGFKTNSNKFKSHIFNSVDRYSS